MIFAIFYFALVLSPSLAQEADDATLRIVPTKEGFVRGTEGQNNTLVFFQVPYGAKPGRFQLPVKTPVRPFGSIYDATSQTVYGCSQIFPDFPYPQYFVEDCLQLNIIKPKRFSNALRPVVVNIVGGSFYFESNAFPDSLPYPLVDEADIVWVSPNFRVGILGDLYITEMNGGNGVNFQLHDILLALNWVHDNIKFFGGDPNNIILAGTSSGSFQANWFAGIPSANKIVKKLLLDEGTLGSVVVSIDDPESANEFGQSVAELVGCSAQNLAKQNQNSQKSVSQLDCLKAVPLEIINEVNYEYGIVGRSIGVDDADLGVKYPIFSDGDVNTLLLTGELKSLPAFTINLQNPGLTFAPEVADELDNNNTLYQELIFSLFGTELAPAVLSFYPTLDYLAAFISDTFWFCPGQIYATFKPATTRYTFWNHRPSFFLDPIPGVIHTSGLPFLIGIPYDVDAGVIRSWGGPNSVPPVVNEYQMSRNFIAQIKQFLYSSEVSYPWGSTRNYVEYNDSSPSSYTLTNFPLTETCEFWTEVWEEEFAPEATVSTRVNQQNSKNDDHVVVSATDVNNNSGSVIGVVAGVVCVGLVLGIFGGIMWKKKYAGTAGYQPV